MEKERVAILGAIREELSALKKKLIISSKFKKGKILVGSLSGEDVVLVETGVGRKNAQKQSKFVLENFNIKFVLSIGYGGGVKEKYKVGDLIFCTRALLANGNSGFKEGKKEPFETKKLESQKPFDVANKLSSSGISFQKGGILTVDSVIESVEEKKWIGEVYSVDAVEMETFAVATETEKKGVPLISLRAISDTLNDQLINVNSLMDKKGEISKVKAGLYVISHPGAIPKFLSMRENSLKATQVLTEAVLKILGQPELVW